MTNKIQKIHDILERTGIEIISYGLAPNPGGFCFEVPEDFEESDYRLIKKLDSLLDSLSTQEEKQLRSEVL